MDQVKEALVKQVSSGVEIHYDIPSPVLPDLYRNRTRDLAWKLYDILGIKREDKEKRNDWALQGVRFFDAPNGIIFYIDRVLHTWSILDTGLLMQTVMLAALKYGLGTCPQGIVVGYPELIRNILDIPESKLLVCGIAIGYPDWDHPANKFISPREPLETFITWHGID